MVAVATIRQRAQEFAAVARVHAEQIDPKLARGILRGGIVVILISTLCDQLLALCQIAMGALALVALAALYRLFKNYVTSGEPRQKSELVRDINDAARYGCWIVGTLVALNHYPWQTLGGAITYFAVESARL